MKAKITYRVSEVPDPFDAEARKQGVLCHCLMRVVKPEIGGETWEAVAVFNRTSEAQAFIDHVYLTTPALDTDPVVELEPGQRDYRDSLLELRARK